MKKLFIIVAATLFVAGSFLPVMAQDKADWSFYGSARMWTEYRSVDKLTTRSAIVTNPLAGLNDEEELIWDLQSNSRVGAVVKWGNIGGQFEYGFGSTVSPRLLFGTWNFGPGTLLVGQDYQPSFWGISGQCGFGGGDCGLINWGEMYTGRLPQIKLIMGGFQVALIKANTTQVFTAGSVTTTTVSVPAGAAGPPGGIFVTSDGVRDFYLVASSAPNFSAVDIDTLLPKIEASYVFNLGPAALWAGAGYNSIDLEGQPNGTTRVDSKSLDSWFGAIGAKANFGPFFVAGKFTYIRNPAAYGVVQDNGLTQASYTFATNSINDVDSMMSMLVVGFKLTDTIKFETGAGWITNSRDNAPGIEEEQETWSYYLQMSWSPAKNVFIIPELGFVDYGDKKLTGSPDMEMGDAFYFAVKWQINF